MANQCTKHSQLTENDMHFLCLIYYDEQKLDSMPEAERNALYAEAYAHYDGLVSEGHGLAGEPLESVAAARTVRVQREKVSITDGPYVETKEQLGGILILEARDLNHAIQLMSKHPGVKAGPFEIRPAEDLSALVAESDRRRDTAHGGGDRR
jgi:hypothetical protein